MASPITGLLLFLASSALQWNPWTEDADMSQYRLQSIQAGTSAAGRLKIMHPDIACPKPYGQFPVENEPSKYVLCYSNESEIVECAEPTVFVEGMGCIDLEIFNPNPEGQPEDVPKGDNILGHWQCGEYRGHFAVVGDCTRYLTCEKNHMKIHSCPEGTHYEGHNRCGNGIPNDCFQF